jgi:chemotaxis protein CheX
MDVKYINPFLSATINVIKTMAFVEAKPGKPFRKSDQTASGDVSGIIGLTGDNEGSLSITFSQSCIEAILTNMLGEKITGINDDVRDAVGEITNMISGDARRVLDEEGVKLTSAIPTVISGLNHTITHISSGPTIAIPFDTEHGPFTVEVCFAH